LAWVVMPTLVHCGIEQRPGTTQGETIRAWKRVSAKSINASCNSAGRVWAKDYFDRFVRDVDHLSAAIRYIHNNPVKASLCKLPEDWPWSSARHGPRWTTKTPSGPDGVF
ncbi:MAG: transposase, partial [Verrucomicrobiota bacterium]